MRVADVVVDRRVAAVRNVSTPNSLSLPSREEHPFMDHKVMDFLTCFEFLSVFGYYVLVTGY